FPQFINPNPAVVADLRFRRAVVHAMDRQQLVDVLQPGSIVGHSSINPNEPEYAAIEPSIVKYEYDPRAATQLIESIGYTRAADSLFRDAADQKLAVKIQTTIDDLRQKIILAVGDYWQQAGITAEPVIIPRQAADDRQLRSTFPAFDSTQSPSMPVRYHSS